MALEGIADGGRLLILDTFRRVQPFGWIGRMCMPRIIIGQLVAELGGWDMQNSDLERGFWFCYLVRAVFGSFCLRDGILGGWLYLANCSAISS